MDRVVTLSCNECSEKPLSFTLPFNKLLYGLPARFRVTSIFTQTNRESAEVKQNRARLRDLPASLFSI